MQLSWTPNYNFLSNFFLCGTLCLLCGTLCNSYSTKWHKESQSSTKWLRIHKQSSAQQTVGNLCLWSWIECQTKTHSQYFFLCGTRRLLCGTLCNSYSTKWHKESQSSTKRKRIHKQSSAQQTVVNLCLWSWIERQTKTHSHISSSVSLGVSSVALCVTAIAQSFRGENNHIHAPGLLKMELADYLHKISTIFAWTFSKPMHHSKSISTMYHNNGKGLYSCWICWSALFSTTFFTR